MYSQQSASYLVNGLPDLGDRGMQVSVVGTEPRNGLLHAANSLAQDHRLGLGDVSTAY